MWGRVTVSGVELNEQQAAELRDLFVSLLPALPNSAFVYQVRPAARAAVACEGEDGHVVGYGVRVAIAATFSALWSMPGFSA